MKKVFLDTCVLLDYFENRDRDIAYIVQRMIESDQVEITTSMFNVIELLDKVQEIRHMAKLVNKKYSYDEISRDRQKKELSKTDREEILLELNDFLQKSKIVTFFPRDLLAYKQIIDLISTINIKSQDALVFTLYIQSESKMFLTKDSTLAKNVKKSFEGVFHAKNDLKNIKKILFNE